jgi:hypothetical protein
VVSILMLMKSGMQTEEARGKTGRRKSIPNTQEPLRKSKSFDLLLFSLLWCSRSKAHIDSETKSADSLSPRCIDETGIHNHCCRPFWHNGKALSPIARKEDRHSVKKSLVTTYVLQKWVDNLEAKSMLHGCFIADNQVDVAEEFSKSDCIGTAH